MAESRKAYVVVRQYSASYLCDVVYGVKPMTIELAEIIRSLWRDYCIDYTKLGYYLCESNPDSGASFGLGKALTELAVLKLNDPDTSWK